MASVTLPQMRSLVRRRAGMERSKFVATDELDGYINASLAELRGLFVTVHENLVTKQALSTVALGPPTISLADLSQQFGVTFYGSSLDSAGRTRAYAPDGLNVLARTTGAVTIPTINHFATATVTVGSAAKLHVNQEVYVYRFADDGNNGAFVGAVTAISGTTLTIVGDWLQAGSTVGDTIDSGAVITPVLQYDQPAVHKLVGLDVRATTSGPWSKLRAIPVQERDRFQSENIAPGYYRLLYVPRWQPLLRAMGDVNDDVFDAPEDWHEYAVIDAAIKCLVKEESDVSALLLAKEKMQARIEAEASDRDEGDTGRVAEVEDESDLSMGPFHFGGFRFSRAGLGYFLTDSPPVVNLLARSPWGQPWL